MNKRDTKITIVRAKLEDAELLAYLGRKTFYDSQYNCAPDDDVSYFLDMTYSKKKFTTALQDTHNIYHLVYYNNEIAGFSNIVCNCANPHVTEQKITKLDRLYLLEEFQGKKIGNTLFDFNLNLSKEAGDKGVWLVVWDGNYKAIDFYEKRGFNEVGKYDFVISKTHTNSIPTMYLKY